MSYLSEKERLSHEACMRITEVFAINQALAMQGKEINTAQLGEAVKLMQAAQLAPDTINCGRCQESFDNSPQNRNVLIFTAMIKAGRYIAIPGGKPLVLCPCCLKEFNLVDDNQTDSVVISDDNKG